MNASLDYSYSALREEPHTGLLYRLRQSGQAAQARLLLLHGVGGNETNLLELAERVDPRVEVLLLQGPLSFGPGRHAWFAVNFSGVGPRIDAEQAERSRRLLVDFIAAQAPVLPTVIAGFSQGGIMSASVGLSAPEGVAGFGILSGRILPELAPHIASPEALRAVQAFIAHGRFDDTLPLSWAEKARHWLGELQVRHSSKVYDAGHEVLAEEIDDFNQWLAEPLSLD